MRFEHEMRNVGDFTVKMGLWTPQTPRTLSHISFHAEILQDLAYRQHSVVSLSQFLQDLSMKRDVQESSWCL